MNQQQRKPPGTGFMNAATLIFRMAIAIGVFVLLGDLLDRLLHVSPWFLVAGIILGVAVVIVDLERKAGSYRRKVRKKSRRAGPGSSNREG